MGMEKRSALSFTLRIKAAVFHLFVQRIAERAYHIGYHAAQQQLPYDPEQVRIDPSQVRKLHP